MSNSSPNIGLPYLLASQAQKQVTINEAFNRLDALIMLNCKSRTSGVPSTPLDGQRYIVPSAASGAWLGFDNKIALYQNLGWEFISPNNGFIAFVEDEAQLYIYQNSTWQKLSDSFMPSVARLGIGTSTDANNPLSAKLNNALFSAKYVAEGGTGDLRYKLNKEASANVLSQLYQTNWSGRAETGLLGDDNFGIKVSADGSNWKTALSIDKTTGRATTLGINFPTISVGSNNLINIGSSSLLWSPFVGGSWGNNMFFGLGAGSPNLAMNAAASYFWEGSNNVSFGNYSLPAVTNGFENTAFGSYALNAVNVGFKNTAIGKDALKALTTGTFNTAIGMQALYYNQDGTTNTTFTNCAGVGFDARVSGSNQVQLGNSSTTTYAYGAVQARSDSRDKADVQDTVLGLDFINAIRPVDYKWDMRDDYFEEVVETDEAGNSYNVLKPIPKDGSKKRHRFHHGVIAQEVKSTCEALGVDFGGYQDHLLSGGNDVKSIGYEEFIAPLIKAVQELSARVKELESK